MHILTISHIFSHCVAIMKGEGASIDDVKLMKSGFTHFPSIRLKPIFIITQKHPWQFCAHSAVVDRTESQLVMLQILAGPHGQEWESSKQASHVYSVLLRSLGWHGYIWAKQASLSSQDLSYLRTQSHWRAQIQAGSGTRRSPEYLSICLPGSEYLGLHIH